jgi:predicted nucleic acid-binding protein
LIAFDTNILIYASQPNEPLGRNIISLELMARVAPLRAILPLQVVGEFINACRKKKISTLAYACERAALWVELYQTPATGPQDFLEAAGVSENSGFQFFDALILTVARRAGATVLLSEDMQDGIDVDGIKVVNPFSPANEALLADYFGSAL